MPKFYEVFGQSTSSLLSKDLLIDAICPLTNTLCDGGGNRHQTKLSAKDLLDLFPIETKIEGKIPAICSITYEKKNQQWVVCPRRLFAFPKNPNKQVNYDPIISDHEQDLINSLGFASGSKIGIYPEVYLKYSDDESEINYHFDYVVCEVLDNQVTLGELWDVLSISDKQEKSKYRKSLKDNGLIEAGAKDDSKIKIFPNLDKMAIIEVMTASTSGSNKEKGTDIKSAYLKFLSGEPYECPGINKRQVWGRMATQLFAKSAITENWGAKTYWAVQDKLLENICKTTKLELQQQETSSSSINFEAFSYDTEGKLSLSQSVSIDSGIDFSGTGKGIDILLAKTYPNKTVLLSCMLRSQLSNVIEL
ncbi:hypothetical protein [Vibrio breoganii]|uniref:Restriction endonuclease n=1 Tax=Vibrio breoganii TaxID=553239 RepID=A0ABX1UF66_9VIBR|nr:hypothetical protein [Vibrio breoganii]NMO75236.1 hypothetical protein [Vibrio breoganii]NMR71752.1 hypothetical protein [Vibrio breoganii]PML82822.1 hypothetical protein BCT67_17965 [Vibrio breoganii]